MTEFFEELKEAAADQEKERAKREMRLHKHGK